jgi:hypothetical protein
MKKTLLLLTLASILISGCAILGALKTGKHILKADFKEQNYLTEVPFEMVAGHLLIKVDINKKLRNFFLDSGAPSTISPGLAKEFNLKTFTTGGKKDGQKITCYLADEIILNGLPYSNVGVIEVNTIEMFKRSCAQIDGLIGANIMCKNIWQIDFQQNKIRITDSLSKLNYLEQAIRMPFKTSHFSRSPVITVKLDNGELIKLVFDTGSNSGITFNTENKKQMLNSFEKKNISEFYTKGYVSILGKGVAEQVDTAYVIKTRLSLGKDSISAQSLTYGRYRNFSAKKNGVIGNAFLKSYIITFDWTTKTVFLYKFKEEEKALGSFGFAYGFVGDKLIVGSISKDSEATKMGINIGDEILQINTYKVSELSSAQLCDYANGRFSLIPADQDAATFIFVSKKGEMKATLSRNKPL